MRAPPCRKFGVEPFSSAIEQHQRLMSVPTTSMHRAVGRLHHSRVRLTAMDPCPVVLVTLHGWLPARLPACVCACLPACLPPVACLQFCVWTGVLTAAPELDPTHDN